MNNKHLMHQALGDDWFLLPEVIRRHYSINCHSESCVYGDMKIQYPDFLLPLIYMIHAAGGLIKLRGKNIATKVVKSTSDDQSSLFWQRSLQSSKGLTDQFSSWMVLKKHNELVEYVGLGFGLRMCVTVENADLIYRSLGHLWSIGSITISIPDWLLLGRATIIEHKIDNQSFELDFQIHHPIWGNSYSYTGVFRYCEQ